MHQEDNGMKLGGLIVYTTVKEKKGKTLKAMC